VTEVEGGVRVDVWLWAARLYKHRSGAAEACTGGHVLVNDAPAKPAKKVKPGDRVQAETPGGLRVVVVLGLSVQRRPAPEASALYEDHSPPPPPPDPWARVFREAGAGRPTSKDRRQLDRLRGDGWE
jgi:ribosome-associated heat shock protein Hsp15